MLTVHLATSMEDRARRELVYGGDLVVLTPTPASLALVDHAREMLTGAFAPHDPRDAQHHLRVEDWVDRFAPVKPAFIHHARTAELIAEMLHDAGADPDDLHVDVPRLRGVTSDGYLTAGVGYAHGPHRDTWYSAPMAQINWWMPIYPCDRESVMSFYPKCFVNPVPNSSDEFDYYQWNADGRANAAKHIHRDTRRQPKPSAPVQADEVRVVCESGALLVFSAAQLHATVPNTSGTTRFSLDFRTVSLEDLELGKAPANVDSHPRGTSLRDFRRLRDGAPAPAEVVSRFDDVAEPTGTLVFAPTASN